MPVKFYILMNNPGLPQRLIIKKASQKQSYWESCSNPVNNNIIDQYVI